MRIFEKLKPWARSARNLGFTWARSVQKFSGFLLISEAKPSKMVGAKRPKIWGYIKTGFPENKIGFEKKFETIKP